MAAAYAIWHGPAGLRAIAEHVHGLAARFAAKAAGVKPGARIFDTVTVTAPGKAKDIAGRPSRTGG
jgi:glycine dehydrogenase